jgi:hypothetical protein
MSVNYRVVRCYGGWNVHGHRHDYARYTPELVFECLHLHETKGDAGACKRELEAARGGVSPSGKERP